LARGQQSRAWPFHRCGGEPNTSRSRPNQAEATATARAARAPAIDAAQSSKDGPGLGRGSIRVQNRGRIFARAQALRQLLDEFGHPNRNRFLGHVVGCAEPISELPEQLRPEERIRRAPGRTKRLDGFDIARRQESHRDTLVGGSAAPRGAPCLCPVSEAAPRANSRTLWQLCGQAFVREEAPPTMLRAAGPPQRRLMSTRGRRGAGSGSSPLSVPLPCSNSWIGTTGMMVEMACL
jgi:hypothetical protein